MMKKFEELQKEQQKLEKDINDERIKQHNLQKLTSISRLEELIKPLSEKLDKREHKQGDNYHLSPRQNLRSGKPPREWDFYKENPAHFTKDLAYEEIFVTILGILKKHESYLNLNE